MVVDGGGQTDWGDSITELHGGGQLYDGKVIVIDCLVLVVGMDDPLLGCHFLLSVTH